MKLKFHLYHPGFIELDEESQPIEIITFKEIYNLEEVQNFKGKDFKKFRWGWVYDYPGIHDELTLSATYNDQSHLVVGFLRRYNDEGQQIDI